MGGEIVNIMPDSAPNSSHWVVVSLGCAAVISAIVAITRRTSLASAVAMVASSLCLAGLHAALSWHFLGAVQIMLWAGTLLAFFVFNVISLNRDDTEPVAVRGIVTRVAALCASFWMMFFVVRLVMVAAWPVFLEITSPQSGSTATLGRSMFGELGFPMQMLAVGLLLTVLGGLSLTRVASAERS